MHNRVISVVAVEQIEVVKLADQFGSIRVESDGLVARHVVPRAGDVGEVLTDHRAAQLIDLPALQTSPPSTAGRPEAGAQSQHKSCGVACGC